MVTNELIARFESGRIDPGWFDHRAHLHLTWGYLRRKPLFEVLRLLSEGFSKLAADHGAPDKYHQTVTWAYVFIVNERMAETSADDFDTFAAANVDLIEDGKGVLERCYEPSVLWSDRARRTFIFPRASR